MTPPLSDTKERISLQDLMLAERIICGSNWIGKLSTYAFDITSDTVTDSEETC